MTEYIRDIALVVIAYILPAAAVMSVYGTWLAVALTPFALIWGARWTIVIRQVMR